MSLNKESRLSRIPRAYRGLRSFLSQQYELVRWVVFVFLGGSINSLAVQLYGNYFSVAYEYASVPLVYYTAQQLAFGIVQFLLFTGLLFITPILLSLSLTRLMPTRQVVPPFYIQLITLGLLYGVTYSRFGASVITFLTLYVGTFYSIFAGLIQDGIVARLMGKGVLREDIIPFTIVAESDMTSLAKVLSRKECANWLDINPNYTETKGTILFLPDEYAGRHTSIKLSPIPNETDKTKMDICIWREGRYDFQRDANLEEAARRGMAYLRDILTYPRPDEDRNSIKFSEIEPHKATDFVEAIMDESGGVIVHTEQISVIGWIQLAIFAGMVSASFGLLVIGGTEFTLAGVGALVSIGVYVVFSLPSRFGRRGLRHI
jgi:hypothetical protein